MSKKKLCLVLLSVLELLIVLLCSEIMLRLVKQKGECMLESMLYLKLWIVELSWFVKVPLIVMFILALVWIVKEYIKRKVR